MPRDLLSALFSLVSVVLVLSYLAACSSASDPAPADPKPQPTIGTCTLVPPQSNCDDLASMADPSLPAAKQIYEYDCPPDEPTDMRIAVTIGECADRSAIFNAPTGAIFCCSY